MERILLHIYNFFKKYPYWFYISFTLSFALVAFFASKVKLEEDLSKVLPKDKKIEKLNQVFQNSKFIDKLVIMVSLKDTTQPDPDLLIAYADSFSAQVRGRLSAYVTKVADKVDDGMAMQLFATVNDRLPVYLEEKDYLAIDTLIEASRVKQTLEQNLRTLTSPAGLVLKDMISNDPVGISFIALKRLQQLQYDENFELYDNYIVTRNQHHLLMFLTPTYPPANTGKNAEMMAGLDSIINELAGKEFEGVDATYFGASAVSVGNALQLRKDSIFTQGITVLFIIVFLGFYFRKKRAPFIILIPVLFGALFSLAAIYFIKGSISVIALGTGSVVLGIAVNYSLHVFNHFRHTRSIEQVIKDLTLPLTVGSFTTIGGFLCLEFVESEMLKDLGLFAAFSLMGASICSLLFLPHFISSKKEQAKPLDTELSWIDKLASYKPEYNKYLVLGIFILTLVFGYTSKYVGFESDLLGMNYMPDHLKKAEARLNKINEYALQSVYLVTEGRTLNEALVNNEKLTAKVEALKERNVVKKYSGVSSLIISDSLQKVRIERWKQFWTTEKKAQLLNVLESEGAALGFKKAAFNNFNNLINKDFEPAEEAAMQAVRNSFLEDYITEKKDYVTVVTLVKVQPEHKSVVYKEFENDLLTTVVDKQYLTEKFVSIINADFSKIALMSSILVFAVLLITFGRIELALVSFVPMLITWIWILGIMGILGIQFNIINIIISALIFGLGDDYSLFIMDGLLREYKTGRKNLASYKSSIFLSAITTLAGLGVLIFAKHPALKSIALISIIGIVCVVVISQILIPFFFRLLIKNRVLKNRFPWTLSGFLKSVLSFTIFLFGCILLTVVGLLFKLIPFGKENTKLLYHRLLSWFGRLLMNVMSKVKLQYENPLKEDLNKPAIIISNHQSFLDILSLIMLHPKIILFTNNWVWNSPVFGAVVKMADYYPVANGAENSIDLLRERVRNGYSIAIFPEGTRSVDDTIKRFHKGAFFLAEKLNMDILPIVIHGSGNAMSKGDFLLKNCAVTLKFLNRIKPEDQHLGTGYAERAKLVGRYFRNEHNLLKKELEQPAYFHERLIYNYLYKGPVLEWYMKVKVKLEKDYTVFHDLISPGAKILDVGCGYGFMSYMLHFAAPERIVTGLDYDEEKVNTANNCFDKNERINFVASDVLGFEFEQYDAIILADMLHYLQEEDQKTIIERCVRNLNPGGIIIIREGNRDMEEKHKGTKLTEFFSTRLLGFNKTSGNGLSFLSGKLINDLAAANGMECKVIDQTKYTSNIIFVLTHKQESNDG